MIYDGGRRGSLSTMTHHQCQNVCDWKTTERPTKRNSAPFSHVHTSKVRNILPAVAIPLSKSGQASFPPSQLNTTNKEAHKQNEGNPHFGEGHKIFKTVASLQARPPNERRKPGIKRKMLRFHKIPLRVRSHNFAHPQSSQKEENHPHL